MEAFDMANISDPKIAIIGGGPGGLMLARLLQVRGIAPTIFERDAHGEERPQGGSLDLHAGTGQRAMRLAGLEQAFLAAARPEDQGDRLYDPAGTLLFDRDGLGDDRPEIDRTALRRILLESLEPGVVRWGSKVEAIVPAPGGGYQVIVDGAAESFDVVVGADGAWSRVRPLLSDAAPIYEGVTLVELGFDTELHPGVDALVGGGKMFAVGDNRVLIGQRNGHGHIRGYTAQRMPESAARALAEATPEQVRATLLDAFAGWAPSLIDMIEHGVFIGVRPLYALPVGHRWASRPGLTLLGDAAHLMSPFGGEGVNLALADAADLADALTSGAGWDAVTSFEEAMIARAAPAAQGAAKGLQGTISPAGVAPVLAHYRRRVAA
jgi:2-polyprenyl-6-methoxyphenol hydroxylase-like FAD-dependent oxidoreductase